MSSTSDRLQQETREAYDRLAAYGKTPADVGAFLAAYMAYTKVSGTSPRL